ncbi:glycosyltransferase family 1 protein [Sporolactobacillus sp. THM7-4]|nr:glycosyltransferase family 1 protein [Sporolactobacillus sp. THM7-4]
METAIVTSGYLPVPAAMGGAVESLVENLLKKNEEFGKLDLVVFSTYHDKSLHEAKKFKRTKFIFIKPPRVIRIADQFVYFIAKNILKKEKSMSYRYILQRLHYLSKVSKFLQKNNYDKVVLENHSTLFMALKKHGNYKKYAGRYYYHLHNAVTRDYGCKEIMLQSKRVLGVSRYIDRTLSEFLGGCQQEKLGVLRNCVDTSRFGSPESKRKADLLRQKYHIAPDDKVVLFSGRLTREKGIKELLQAFASVHLPKTKLVIAGGYFYASGMVSDYEKELQKMARSLSDRVIFTGFIHYADMPAVYSMADVAVIPSIWDDPAPLTVIESMASGLALITTDSGGIPEYVSKDCTILIKRDPQLVHHLAEALIQVLNDDLLRRNMARASRRCARKMNLNQYYTNFVKEITH